jgi:hypothetical protein
MDQAVARQHIRQNLSRILEPEFWDRIRKSEAGYAGAAKSFLVLTRNWIEAGWNERFRSRVRGKQEPAAAQSLKDKLMDALGIFPGPIQIILSLGDPATAIFQDAAKEKLDELNRQGRLTVMTEPEANHVFSRSDWRRSLIDWSLDWTKKLG